jgi:hypothetical protein
MNVKITGEYKNVNKAMQSVGFQRTDDENIFMKEGKNYFVTDIYYRIGQDSKTVYIDIIELKLF